MKHPYIGQSKVSDTTVLFVSMSKGVSLDVENAQYHDVWDESVFKNITREYLANTYGKVESKEHAEFIVKLAESAGLCCLYGVINGSWRSFYFDSKTLFFTSFDINCSDSMRLTTLPLPPKNLAPTATQEEEFEMQQIERNNKVEEQKAIFDSDFNKSIYSPDLPNNGDNLLFAGESQSKLEEMVYDANKKNAAIKTLENLGYTYHGAELWKPPVGKIKEWKHIPHPLNNFNLRRKVEKHKEWPAVGDEVILHGRPCRVIGVDGDAFWIKKESGRYDIASRHQLQKPKTPEEELRDDLNRIIGTAIANELDCESVTLTLLSKYNITKKPQ